MNNRYWTMIAFLLTATAGLSAERYAYRQTPNDGGTAQTVMIAPEGDNLVVNVEGSPDGVKHLFILDSACATKEWRILRADGTETVFVREGNVILASGAGVKANRKPARVDDLPWYASIGIGLAAFARSGKEKTEFWIVNPENGKAYRMTATRIDEGSALSCGDTVPAILVRITASGIPAAFFSMRYWFRSSDGMMIRYEGKEGGPGSADTTLELIEEER